MNMEVQQRPCQLLENGISDYIHKQLAESFLIWKSAEELKNGMLLLYSPQNETYYRYIEVLKKYNEKYAEANQQMNLFA
jgi:hypothetical protein